MAPWTENNNKQTMKEWFYLFKAIVDADNWNPHRYDNDKVSVLKNLFFKPLSSFILNWNLIIFERFTEKITS
jgi:hypothetical protein